MILCDTNILIELYKNNPIIISELRKIGSKQIAISSITQAELYYGALNKQELLKIKRHLSQLEILVMDRIVSERFIQLMESYALSHKLTIPDAIIAATALVNNLDLYSLNKKDFRFISNLNLY
ncbi:MAG: type II toxin-antitoxin system VapC family toxin [Cyanobacteria bacterium P01_F01_bin.143]